MSEHVTLSQEAWIADRKRRGLSILDIRLSCLVCGLQWRTCPHPASEVRALVAWWEAECRSPTARQVSAALNPADPETRCCICGHGLQSIHCRHYDEHRAAFVARLRSHSFDELRAMQLGENLRTSGETAPSTAAPTKENTMTESTTVQSITDTINEVLPAEARSEYPGVVNSVTAALVEREYKISEALVASAVEQFGVEAELVENILVRGGMYLRPKPQPEPEPAPVVELTHEQKLDAIMGFIADITPRLDGIDDSIAGIKAAAQRNGISI